MTQIKRTVPTKGSEFRIRHFKIFSDPAIQLDNTEDGRLYLLSLLLDVKFGVVLQQKKADIDKWLDTYERAISTLDLQGNPPNEITVNGKDYVRIDPNKVSYGWHRDFKACDINKDPVRMACLFYYPKGSYYGEMDVNDNLIHPIKDRYQDFEEDFPLDIFMKSSAFFLQKSYESLRKSILKRKAEIHVMKVLRFLHVLKKKKPLTQ